MLRTPAPLIGALGLTSMNLAVVIIAGLWAASAAANAVIDPAVREVASPSQLEELISQAEKRFGRTIEKIELEPCWYAPQCVEAVTVTSERQKNDDHSVNSLFAVFFPAWRKPPHPIAPSDMKVRKGSWLSSEEVSTISEYRVELLNETRFVAFQAGVSFEEASALMRAVEARSYRVAPEFEHIAAMYESKSPGVLRTLRPSHVRTISRKSADYGKAFELNAFSPENGETAWEFQLRGDEWLVQQFSPIYH